MRKKMRMKDKVFRLLLAFLFVFNVGFSATNLVFATGQNGTTLSAVVTLNCDAERTYNWSISKTVDHDNFTLASGETATANYTVGVDKTGYTDKIMCSGVVTVTNGGAVATEGLAIKLEIDDTVVATVDTRSKPVLAPGESYNYEYSFEYGGTVGSNIKVTADVTIMNHSGHLNIPFGPNPSATATYPTSVNEVNSTINVTDTYSGSGAPWTFSDSGSKSYSRNFGTDESGTISNTAEIIETNQSATADVVINRNGIVNPTPKIELTKSAHPTSAYPGQTVTYTMTVTSNVALTGVTVTDPKIPGLSGNIGNLAANTPTSVSGTYMVPLDAVAGSTIQNTATVTGNYENDPLSATATANISVIAAPIAPTLTITKSADPTSAYPGQTVTYTMTVTSNVALTGVTVTDPKIPGLSGNIGNLAANTPTSVSGTYMVPLDAAAGSTIQNTATVTGNYENDPLSATATANISVIAVPIAPSLIITKSADPATVYPGQMVTYSMTVTGNVDLTNVVVTDSKIPTLNGSIGHLTANTPVTVSGTYMVPFGTADGSTIDNTAFVTGNYGEQVLNDNDTVTITVKVDQGNPEQPVPGLSITKTADRSSAHRGDTIKYTITVKNTGDTDLEGIKVADGMLEFNDSISLKSGVSKTYENLEYVVPSDQPYGTLKNTATASCNDPELSDSDSVNVQINQKSSGGGGGGSTTIDEETPPLGEAKLPALTVTKTVDKALAAPGDKVKYSITVKNSGNVDLLNVAVTDQLVGLNETIASLKAGDGKTFTKDYVIPQNAAGSIKNTAVAEAVYNGTKVSADGSAVTNIEEQIIEDNTPLGDAKFPTETINDDKTPLAEAKLPKTGGIPMSDLVVLGSGLAALGLVIRRKR